MNEALDHKCPSCNAVLKFNPHGQNWKCEYCRSEFNLEQITTYEEKVGKTLEKEVEPISKGEMDLYSCPNCGAQIIADPNVSTTSCVYCKNTTILKDKLQGEFNPNYVIPFKHTKEDAINAFKKLGKGKILMPKAFNEKKNINEMSGIYIPFWLYDFEANGVMEADCKRITSWRSGDYRYTKTDTYLATRGGSMKFNHVPADGSKRFDNAIMNSIEPFDYKDLKEFNYSYLSGFLSEKYDVT
ncbi:MAG: DNA helicase PriA, partial [Bacilli bacterium]|nr:DNA helicase PriA [Bacilli bacterium]